MHTVDQQIFHNPPDCEIAHQTLLSNPPPVQRTKRVGVQPLVHALATECVTILAADWVFENLMTAN